MAFTPRATTTFFAPLAPSASRPCASPKVTAVIGPPASWLAQVTASCAAFGSLSPRVSMNAIVLMFLLVVSRFGVSTTGVFPLISLRFCASAA
jgi:hypothetical protein